MTAEFDKQQVLDTIIRALEARVEIARIAVQTAYETATHEENIAENKYDTLGLEAAYLTQGQARRLVECEADLATYKNFTPKSFGEDDAIGLGALVQLEDAAKHSQYLFLGPAAGGLKIEQQDVDILVITPSAPLGHALLGRFVDDAVSVRVGASSRHYEIVAVF